MIKRKEVKHILSLDSLAPGAKSNLLDCKTLELRDVSSLAITIRVTHHSSATKPVVVHVVTGIDTMTFDTTDYATFECHLLPGSESQTTRAITPDAFYMKVQLENQDSSYPATDIDVWATLGYEE